MRRILIFLICLIFLLFNVNSGFSISGPCSECHTMHNSQNGQTVAKNGTSSQPFRALTIGDCVFCHTGTNTVSNNIPYVNSNSQPTYVFGGDRNTLAGGNFYWVQSDDTKGHNVVGIAGIDSYIGLTPPGYDPSKYPEFDKYRPSTWDHQLTCAGNFGCHGKFDATDPTLDDPFKAISGAHHKNIVRTNGTAPADEVWESYRFLWGIKGTEDPNYELNPDTTHHNGYYASTSPTDQASINYLCGECHGVFHRDTYNGTYASPWLRHPTDFDMNTVKGKEYGSYPNPTLFSGKLGVSAVGDYFADVPVGNTQGAVWSTVLGRSGDAIVLCLSCHRAHGSPYPDLLRWDYSACQAGNKTANCGCLACHTKK